MPSLLAGEHRRAVIMGAVGVATIAVLLVFRLFAGGDDDFGSPIDSAPVTTPVPQVNVPVPPAPAPAASPPVDPALLRDPFCPLVAAPAAPESRPVVCRRGAAPPGRQVVRLNDIFAEAGIRLARMHVGPVTFPNLHEGDAFADSFRVVSLSERCGEFDFAGQPFSLCEGEETIK